MKPGNIRFPLNLAAGSSAKYSVLTALFTPEKGAVSIKTANSMLTNGGLNPVKGASANKRLAFKNGKAVLDVGLKSLEAGRQYLLRITLTPDNGGKPAQLFAVFSYGAAQPSPAAQQAVKQQMPATAPGAALTTEQIEQQVRNEIAQIARSIESEQLGLKTFYDRLFVIKQKLDNALARVKQGQTFAAATARKEELAELHSLRKALVQEGNLMTPFAKLEILAHLKASAVPKDALKPMRKTLSDWEKSMAGYDQTLQELSAHARALGATEFEHPGIDGQLQEAERQIQQMKSVVAWLKSFVAWLAGSARLKELPEFGKQIAALELLLKKKKAIDAVADAKALLDRIFADYTDVIKQLSAAEQCMQHAAGCESRIEQLFKELQDKIRAANKPGSE